MDLNNTKYENAILYFTKYCNNQYLGVTKLNKLLYYLDFVSFRDRGVSVTNDTYIHKEYGPVPDRVDDVLHDLRAEEKLMIRNISYAGGFKAEFSLGAEPDLGVFDEYEINLLKNICKEFSLWSTTKIVNQTHLEAPWFFSDPYETVDYQYASDLDFFREGADTTISL